ncbi:MAG: hypothetical protein RLZZ502_1124 [Pseudomonadota bacterium]
MLSQYATHVGLPDTVVVAERAQEKLSPAGQQYVLSDPLFDALSGLSTPTGILGLGKVPQAVFDACTPRLKVLALDDVQDPGNLGTLLRTAAAAGVDEVWCSPHCAFAWAPKTLRASQGMQFALRVHEQVNLLQALESFKGSVVATALHEAKDYRRWQASDSWCLIMGSEGQGVSPALLARAEQKLCLPMRTGVESLNVAVAAGVLLYHFGGPNLE